MRDDLKYAADKRSRVIQWLLQKRIPFIKKQRDEAITHLRNAILAKPDPHLDAAAHAFIARLDKYRG